MRSESVEALTAGMGEAVGPASIGLLLATVYYYLFRADVGLSEDISAILAVVYLLSLMFSLWTHQCLFGGAENDRQPGWICGTPLIVLLLATAGLARMGHTLLGSGKLWA